MTQTHRVFLNVIATYGRSLYSLVIGLFTSRWVLLSLGQIDYGLYGLVGGLTGIVLFVNNLLSTAVMRFYAVSIGAARVASDQRMGIENCRRWFNVALMLHTFVPTCLILCGYPIGEWAVRHFLVIPPERLNDCLWVWRLSCISCFAGMANVPFQAMYSAKQEIAELTGYSFCTTTLNAAFFYYMISHPGVWLTRYAIWMCLASVLPQLIIALRAVMKYPECRFRLDYMWDMERTKQILAYAAARTWTALTAMTSVQGRAILVNRFLGPVYNASMAVGNNVAYQASSLSSSVSTAFWPMIANTAGEGNVEKVKKLSFQVCRISTIMVLVFLVPLSLEIDEVLVIWLKNPPICAAEICVAIMFTIVCERLSEGYWMAVMGLGKRIGYYSWIIGWAAIFEMVIVWLLLLLGMGVKGICLAIVLANVLMIAMRLYLGRILVGMSVQHWILKVGGPILVLCMGGVAVGLVTRLWLPPSFTRVCMTTLLVEVVMAPCAWFFVLSRDERQYIAERFLSRVSNVWRR